MLETVNFSIEPIYTNLAGFSQIAMLSSAIEKYQSSEIFIDMKKMDWCDGNMCALLGAILYRASRNLNNLLLINIVPKMEKLLCRNGFLTNYGHSHLADAYGSTI